jgi:hypothetical protein
MLTIQTPVYKPYIIDAGHHALAPIFDPQEQRSQADGALQQLINTEYSEAHRVDNARPRPVSGSSTATASGDSSGQRGSATSGARGSTASLAGRRRSSTVAVRRRSSTAATVRRGSTTSAASVASGRSCSGVGGGGGGSSRRKSEIPSIEALRSERNQDAAFFHGW